jgi:hypothetical protein
VTRYVKVLITALAALALAFFVPMSAQADTSLVAPSAVDPSMQTPTVTEVAHNCTVLGHDSNNQAVLCADIIHNSATGYYPEVEAMCQSLTTPTDYPQCANQDVVFTGYDTNGANSETAEGVCGHAAGPCINGGRDYYTEYYFNDLSCANIWTDIAAGSTIELPGSDQTKTLSANFASAHYNIPC